MRFFTTELVTLFNRPDGCISERPVKLQEIEGGYMVRIQREKDTSNHLYFRGSNRQFVDMDEFECDFEFSEGPNLNVDQVVIFSGYRGAWNVDLTYFEEKAKEYKIDIRTFVWEQGLEWSSVNTWYRNGKREQETRSYSNWLWDASMPYYGG